MELIIEHWPEVVGAGAAVLVLIMVFWRQLSPRIRYVLRVTRALATDRRLPGPLRWLIGVGVAIKGVPGPDLGIDEVVLAVAAGWLFLRHRDVLRAVLAEARR